MITQQELKEIVFYNPDTGDFFWAKNRKKCTKGSKAGSQRADGYVLIRLNYQRYYAHRLAWLYMTGSLPEKEIDHADGNPSNNAWGNLREATPRQNMQNRPVQSNNSSGLKGVRVSQGRIWASICVNGQSLYLGSYKTPKDAHKAYTLAAKKYFGEFARY